MARYLFSAVASAALAAALAAPHPASGEGRPGPGEEHPTESRNRIDPAFSEFLAAMQRIKSRYAENAENEKIERLEKQRLEGPPSGAAPAPRDPRYGPDFAALPLEIKLKVMQDNAKSDMLKLEQERRERMKKYEDELDEKSRRFDETLPKFPASLVKSGEPATLVDAFRKQWLRAKDPFYHRELLGTYFSSGIPAERVEDFLREVYAEFKTTRPGLSARPSP